MAALLVKETIQRMVAAAIEQARQEGVLQLETTPNILVPKGRDDSDRPGDRA